MGKLGDKIGSKLIAEEVGVPVAPWSGGPVDTLDAAMDAAARIGYPLMLKATAGGGGRGIRVVTSEAELAEAYQRSWAIVNFDGPIVFCVISRYHGGAFVVFPKALNPRMTVVAVEGSFASVIGAPAAAVVFSGDVDARTAADARVRDLEARLQAAIDAARAPIAAELAEVRAAVRAEKLAEVAAEFDGVHSIHRAVDVGSVDLVINPHELRPHIIAVLDEGVAGPP